MIEIGCILTDHRDMQIEGGGGDGRKVKVGVFMWSEKKSGELGSAFNN